MTWQTNNEPEHVKIKAEMAEYINGLNSRGQIDYDTYSEAYDVIMGLLDRMYSLGRHEAVEEVNEEY